MMLQDFGNPTWRRTLADASLSLREPISPKLLASLTRE
jgi:hypothetical protein